MDMNGGMGEIPVDEPTTAQDPIASEGAALPSAGREVQEEVPMPDSAEPKESVEAPEPPKSGGPEEEEGRGESADPVEEEPQPAEGD